MAALAIVTWFCTVLIGLYLLAVWLIENDVRGRTSAASRLPGPVLLGHGGLAITGLLIWGFYLYSDNEKLAWGAGYLLVVVAMAGLFMFTRWLPVHRAYESPTGPHHHHSHAVIETPAERHFRVSVVVSHGLLAVTTVTLVWLTLLTGT